MDADGKLLHREHTFFGVLRVIEGIPSKHSLIHGYVLHGEQWMNPDPRIRNRPLLCFYPTGPIGQVFREFLLMRPPRPIGVVGLVARARSPAMESRVRNLPTSRSTRPWPGTPATRVSMDRRFLGPLEADHVAWIVTRPWIDIKHRRGIP